MCTAISVTGGEGRHFFGRTLDLEFSYGESVVALPVGHRYSFLHEGTVTGEYDIIGAAHTVGGVPLFYDGMNSAGVAMAALNFPGCAVYNAPRSDMGNLAAYEVIPWVLSQCGSVAEAVELLSDINITDERFDRSLPTTPLHWMISDETCSVVAEPLLDGLVLSDNPFGIMTNSPDISHHSMRAAEYSSLSPKRKENTLAPMLELDEVSRGLGAYGMPGDFSSSSRFVRGLFIKNHTRTGGCSDVERFFHIMDTVSVPLGAVLTDGGEAVCTVYTSCMDTKSGIYYFNTYKNRGIRAVKLSEAASGVDIASFSMESESRVDFI